MNQTGLWIVYEGLSDPYAIADNTCNRFKNVNFAVISGLQWWIDLLMHVSAYDISFFDISLIYQTQMPCILFDISDHKKLLLLVCLILLANLLTAIILICFILLANSLTFIILFANADIYIVRFYNRVFHSNIFGAFLRSFLTALLDVALSPLKNVFGPKTQQAKIALEVFWRRFCSRFCTCIFSSPYSSN